MFVEKDSEDISKISEIDSKDQILILAFESDKNLFKNGLLLSFSDILPFYGYEVKVGYLPNSEFESFGSEPSLIILKNKKAVRKIDPFVKFSDVLEVLKQEFK